MTIIRLGETFGDEIAYWYETPAGRVACDQDTLHGIWFAWIQCEGGKRTDVTNGIIYEFAKPTKISVSAPLPYYEND